MLSNIKGTKDILPEESRVWQAIEDRIRRICSLFNYEEIRTPIIEYQELFRKSAGEGSDVVSKEMYTFPDRSNEMLCLRPELTAPVARAVAQYTMLRARPTLRLWYQGPCFRYERPQLGRQRQFNQIGVECIGPIHPEADAEVIVLANDLIKACGVNTFQLEINTLGSSEVRKHYRELLVAFLSQHETQLSADSQRRLHSNPLRILDSKDEADKAITALAPKLTEVLDETSNNHFRQVLSILDACGVSYTVNPFLVRGLDYYSHTVFEFKTRELGAQDAIGGGGRYDNLFETLQAPPASGIGFGIGMERLVLLSSLAAEAKETSIDCAIVYDSPYVSRALLVASQVRQRGLSCTCDLQRRSFKAQLKEADKLNARYVIFIGKDEYDANTMTIKDMHNGSQKTFDYQLDSSYTILTT